MSPSSKTSGPKDNHDIREDPAAFMEAYARASEAFAGIPGVLGVGYGHVSKGGEFRVALGFQVFVHEKRAEAEVPESERIPKTFEGYRVDVRAAEVMKPLESNPDYFNGKGYDARVSPIVGGIQIEPRQKALPPTGECKAAGTLGCIVKRRHKGGGDDNVYLLTNNHVLEGPDDAQCQPRDYVYQPYASKSTDPKPGLMLGAIASMPDKKEYEHTNAFGTFSTYLDCAIASIHVGSTCCGSVCGERGLEYATTIKGLGPAGATFEDWITDVRDACGDTTLFVNVPRNTAGDGQISQTQDLALGNALVMANATATKVRKVGRSSGCTVGLVVSANAWGYQLVFGNLTIIHGFLEIMIDPYFNDGQGNGRNRNGRRSFADDGDSGSIVVDDQNRAIGIVFGGPPASQRQSSQWGVTWASHILPALKLLDVYIPTKDEAGTHEGSDGAWAALTLPRSTPRGDPATKFFTSGGRSAAIEPRRETDLAGLGDRLRSSEAGARLFAVLQQHQRELSHLVGNSRAVKVIWHRHEGPAFLAQILNHLRGNVPRMPVEIRGVQRRVLLMRLRAAFMTQGSYELQCALEEHGDLMLALSAATTFDECLEILEHPHTALVDA
jgi:hypothetical protein